MKNAAGSHEIAEVRIELDQSPIDVADGKAFKAELNRRRAADEKNALAAMRDKLKNRRWNVPSGYTWHHAEDGWMQLVPTAIHDAAVPHVGEFGWNIRRLIAIGKVKVGGIVKGTVLTVLVTMSLAAIAGEHPIEAVGEAFDPMGQAPGGIRTLDAAEPKRLPKQPTPEEWHALDLFYADYIAVLEKQRAYVARFEVVYDDAEPLVRQVGRTQLLFQARIMFKLPKWDPELYGLSSGGYYYHLNVDYDFLNRLPRGY